MSTCDYDLEPKYTKPGAIAARLIDGFYEGLSQLVSTAAPKEIYEIACGSGFSTVRIRGMAPSASLRAGELEPRLVESARRQNPGIEIGVANIYSMPLPDSDVDLVIALEVLEHLECPADAVAEIHRVTSRYAIFSVPNEPIWRMLNMARLKYLPSFGNTPGHLNHWSTAGFLKLIGARFNIVQVRTPLPWSIALAEKRLER